MPETGDERDVLVWPGHQPLLAAHFASRAGSTLAAVHFCEAGEEWNGGCRPHRPNASQSPHHFLSDHRPVDCKGIAGFAMSDETCRSV